jgi:F5/8 type C domain
MSDPGRRHAYAIGSAALGYTLLAVLLTWPLILQLPTVVPHDLGDPLLSTSALWWNAHVTPLTARWWDGYAFFPGAGATAFSDHRLGESLFATPLQWIGASPVTAYNVTLLATFPLCAIAAYWLGLTLTRRHDAACLCGLAYGFNPYRMAHLEHLELLAAFGMPAALAALHLYARTRRRRWLIVFGAAVVIQALCTTYYALFFCVLLALWLPWFFRWEDRRAAAAIVATCVCALAIVAPIGIGYWRIHQAYGFARTFREIQALSADLSSFVTASPMMVLWGWTSSLNGPERQLFPGLTIVALTLAGLGMSQRTAAASSDRLSAVANWLAGLALGFIAVALSALWLGPWNVGPVTVRDAFKPFSVAVALFALSIACHPAMRDAFRRRSPFAFYVIAAIILFVCSLGPTPMFLGQPILYRPPYAWLMHLPLFAYGVRAPARLAMPAVLALSAAAALAFDRFRMSPRARRALAIVLAAGVAADGWIHGLALPAVPGAWQSAGANGVTGVLELPPGDTLGDAAAMYRATLHGRRTVNGMSGYDPLFYVVLRLALDAGDPTALDALAESGPLLVAVEKPADGDRRWRTFLSSHPGVTPLEDGDRWTLFRLARHDPPPRAGLSGILPIVEASDNDSAVDVAAITDNDPETGWMRAQPQFAGQLLQLDLGRQARVDAVVMSLGKGGELFPRSLIVETSLDGRAWETGFAGKTGGSAFRAVLANPRDARIELRLPPGMARFVRLRVDQTDRRYPWIVADVSVRGAP